MQTKSRAKMLAEDEGEAIWFANALMLVKASTDTTEGRFALLDQRVPGNYAVPLHVHHAEDEAWYLLDGEVTFHCGDEQFVAGPGSWVFLPRDVPHTFKVGPSGARLITISAPSGFADFVRELGEPAPALTLPPQDPIDGDRMSAVAARYGVEILGPPPA
jgi:mannose-6-phosphate isomerase-like protein (cupin superfamily)